MRGHAAWLLGMSLFLAVGCQGKLPGPTECEQMAMAYYGLSKKDMIVNRVRRAAVEELTRECLTLPYDRKTVRCMVESNNRTLCRLALERRLQASRGRY